MTEQDDFIFTDDFRESMQYDDAQYCWYVLVIRGSAHFAVGNESYNVIAGNSIIKAVAKPFRDFVCSDDFLSKSLLISWRFLHANMPDSEYNIIGTLSMLQDPVLPMLPTDLSRCLLNFEEIRRRTQQPYHNFYAQVLRRAVETMVFDFYDIHVRHSEQKIEGVSQPMRYMQRFITLLEEGLYKRKRSVDYYASRLFITPKYLSECCQTVSGHNASYWIDRYTTDEIVRQLHNHYKTLAQIADELNFSSASYLSRYVTQKLGCSPSEYRKRLK